MHLDDGPSGSRSFNEIEFLDITGSVRDYNRLGGLLKHYERAA